MCRGSSEKEGCEGGQRHAPLRGNAHVTSFNSDTRYPQGSPEWDAKHRLHLMATKPCTCNRVQRIVVFQAVKLAERVAVLRTDSWQTGQQSLEAENSSRNQDPLGFEF